MRLLLAVVALLLINMPVASADVRPMIVGGSRVSIEDYRYTVFFTDPAGYQFCGGALVSATKVVTAAHCMAGRSTRNTRVVWDREDKYSSDGTISTVSDIWVHPNFSSTVRGADVSVVTLDTSLPGPYLPIASPRDTSLYTPNTMSTILGWGATSSGGSSSRYLLKATVPITTDAACRTAYGTAYIASAMVCAGYASGGVDTCQGDSGGPLIAGGKLIGDTSWGRGCALAGYPGVYGRIASYYDVIMPEVAQGTPGSPTRP
ncbi:serine protease [Actinocrispum sp. NPDC049592]|uniref:S1 family peptidase n=1 Tax=Actinocrispum sp. NPDC049592 TaxID=3154835 RepID=UPI003429078B